MDQSEASKVLARPVIPVVRFVDEMLQDAANDQTSEIHFGFSDPEVFSVSFKKGQRYPGEETWLIRTIPRTVRLRLALTLGMSSRGCKSTHTTHADHRPCAVLGFGPDHV